MYYSLVRSILEYANVVWDPYTSMDIHKLETIQRRAARYCTNNYKYTRGTVTNLLTNLKWPTLQQRRKTARLITMFKIQQHDMSVPIPNYIQRQQLQNTRQFHQAKFRVMRPSTDTYKYSFFPRTIPEWNDLPSSLLDSTELSLFKSGIHKHIY